MRMDVMAMWLADRHTAPAQVELVSEAVAHCQFVGAAEGTGLAVLNKRDQSAAGIARPAIRVDIVNPQARAHSGKRFANCPDDA